MGKVSGLRGLTLAQSVLLSVGCSRHACSAPMVARLISAWREIALLPFAEKASTMSIVDALGLSHANVVGHPCAARTDRLTSAFGRIFGCLMLHLGVYHSTQQDNDRG